VGGQASDAGPVDVCTFSSPTPSTPAEVERDNLIRSFCTAVIDAGCSYAPYGAISTELALAGCSSEDLTRACMIDTYGDYYAYITTPECDALWRATATCMTQAKSCDAIVRFGTSELPQPCDAEKNALSVCWDQASGRVTGSRSSCNYGPDNGQCIVVCDVTAPDYVEANCSGAPGLPLTCDCEVNTHTIWDDGDGMGVRFIAADCRDAALRMADGTCIENLDCCFTWPGSETPPQQHCSCTSDPAKLGYATCEAAAADRGGQVVDLCPQYMSNPGCLNLNDGGC
jgi:hypothetical protein